MSNKKTIIFDYDGTLLLKNQKKISQEIRSILINLRKNGILIILATGRPLNHCQYLLDENLVDYVVSANGGLITSQNKTLQSFNLSQTTIYSVINFCLEHKLPCTFYTTDLLTNGITDTNIEIGLKEAMNINVSELKRFKDSPINNVHLICLFSDNRIDCLLQKTFPKLFISRWHPKIISILDYEVNKTTGIEEILKHHEISSSDCVAVGDGENDIDMLQKAGIGIAVGKNSKISEIADITIDCIDDNFFPTMKKLLKK